MDTDHHGEVTKETIIAMVLFLVLFIGALFAMFFFGCKSHDPAVILPTHTVRPTANRTASIYSFQSWKISCPLGFQKKRNTPPPILPDPTFADSDATLVEARPGQAFIPLRILPRVPPPVLFRPLRRTGSRDSHSTFDLDQAGRNPAWTDAHSVHRIFGSS
ncbi:hypothetical protein C8Q75DRAFT_810766 [Abortiporus biennis]|nr:hypothetical protein C8Q75DRAFT_810766 [Abortiporus biennis]